MDEESELLRQITILELLIAVQEDINRRLEEALRQAQDDQDVDSSI